MRKHWIICLVFIAAIASMVAIPDLRPRLVAFAATVTKGLIGMEDFSLFDGSGNTTFTRASSTGGTLTLDKIGYEVFAIPTYGVVRNSTTINSALTAISTRSRVLVLSAGSDWTLTSDVTIPSTVVLRAPKGVNIVTSGYTITVDGLIDAGSYQIFSGSGGVILNTYPQDQAWTGKQGRLDLPGLTVAGRAFIGVDNLKPVVNATVNILDIFTKSGGAAPSSTNIITVAIPDGTGYTRRTRAATYLSGTSKITMADAANYWSKGSLDGEIKTAYLYAIWDGTGIVWALGGYSGFTAVSASTVATEDDFFLLETSSTYTRSTSHYCVSVAKVRYQYDTADAPDHTIQATVENSPQIVWNQPSDYSKTLTLSATTSSTVSNIVTYSAVSGIVKQAGKYLIEAHDSGYNDASYAELRAIIKTGSSTYASATQRAESIIFSSTTLYIVSASCLATALLNNGDTVHLGAKVFSSTGTVYLYGDTAGTGLTALTFKRID